MPSSTRTVALAITGASGIAYSLRLLECLIAAGARVYVMISKPGQIVIGMESKLCLPGRIPDMQRFLSAHFNAAPGQLQVLGQDQWTAPVASGSSAPEAMAICPCTTGTLAAVACGASRSLLERAADVMLKERRKLILVVRETPLSEIHLQNMITLARMGVVGSLCKIVAWTKVPDGLLGVTAQGTQRIRVVRSQLRGDHLMTGEVEPLPADTELLLPAEFAGLSALLRQIIDEIGPPYSGLPARYDQAGWVAGRLTELLPLQMAVKQRLLETDDVRGRLALLRTELASLHYL